MATRPGYAKRNALDRLTKAGLVRRTAGAGDKRSLPAELTEEGRGRAEVAFREDMVFEAELLPTLTVEERKVLSDLVRKLALSI